MPGDRLRIRRFTIDAADAWMEWSGFSLADVVNEDEDAGVRLGAIGFTRAPKGSTSSFEFPYDEVLVVTKGICGVRSGDEVLTAGVGEVLYLPAGVSGTVHADEDLELVYVASTPYGEANRDMKASLLHEARQRSG
jgi:ethanolamine utilization protein EutQ (cupin superfamily)